MPRPTKAFRRIKINAALAWKRGEKTEAYKMWEKAAAGMKEHLEGKRNKKQKARDAVAAAASAEAAKSA